MTPRQARRQRREAERKVLKQARKAEAAAASQIQTPAPEPSESSQQQTRAEINRQNAQHSTGPKTAEGKMASSRNSFKHGLYSKQLVLASEDPAGLDALKADLRAEHQPASTTEELLVNELAEQYWRLRRMRRYEVEALSGRIPCENWTGLMALIQRSMAASERGFHKTLTALQKTQKERKAQVNRSAQGATEDCGFVPQTSSEETKATQTAQPNGFVSQETTSADFISPDFPLSDDLAAIEEFDDEAMQREFESFMASRAGSDSAQNSSQAS